MVLLSCVLERGIRGDGDSPRTGSSNSILFGWSKPSFDTVVIRTLNGRAKI